MDVQSRHHELRHLLSATGRAHHAVYGGPNPGWSRWYAEHMYGQSLRLLESNPPLDTVEQWLAGADERYRVGAQEESWPSAYATWMLEWDEGAIS